MSTSNWPRGIPLACQPFTALFDMSPHSNLESSFVTTSRAAYQANMSLLYTSELKGNFKTIRQPARLSQSFGNLETGNVVCPSLLGWACTFTVSVTKDSVGNLEWLSVPPFSHLASCTSRDGTSGQ
jgi:hypothetical protein